MVEDISGTGAVTPGALAYTGATVEVGRVATATPKGSNILPAVGKKWATRIFAGLLVAIDGGAGVGQMRRLLGNGPDSLVIRGTWEEALDPSSTFRVILPPGREKYAQEVLELASIAAGATSSLQQCASIDLSRGVSTLAITVEVKYAAPATLGARVHVRTSYDGNQWDSEDWDTWDLGFSAGALVRQTEHYDTEPAFIRVLVENLDGAQPLSSVKVVAATGA